MTPLRSVPAALSICSALVTAVGAARRRLSGVGAGGGDVDGVLEPLPGRGPAEVVAAAGVGGGLQVDPVGAVAVGGAVDRGDVVGDALPAGVVVFRLHGAGHRRRGAAVRGFAGRRRPPAAPGRGERDVVQVPAVAVLVDSQRLLPGRQRDAGGDRGPGLVPAGVRDGDRAAEVGAGRVGDVQRVGDPVGRGDPEAERVGARGGGVDGVVEPLPGRRPAEVVGAGAGVVRGVGGGLEVDPVGAVAVGAAVGRGDVVGDALPAGVVVGRVDGAWHRRRRPAVRGVGRGGRRVVRAGHHRHGRDDRDDEAQAARAAEPRPGPPAPGQPRNVN